MTDVGITEAPKSTGGKVESKAGDVPGQPDLQAKGGARETEGKVQEAIGAVQSAVSQAADQVSAMAAKVGDQAREAYGQAGVHARKVHEHVEPFVQEQPYVALGLAAAAGLLLGLLIAGRGPKIVYVRPPA